MSETKRPAHPREYPAQHTQGEPVMPGQSFLSYQEETFYQGVVSSAHKKKRLITFDITTTTTTLEWK
jgi:hypothetical protein